MFYTAYILFITLIGLSKLFSFSSDKQSDDQLFINQFDSKYNIFAIPKPTSQIDFCGERVPLENPDIWERLIRNS